MTDPSGPQFVQGGNRLDTSIYYPGAAGYYWSSSASTNTIYAYRLYLSDTGSTVDPAGNLPKLRGFTLRCLAQ